METVNHIEIISKLRQRLLRLIKLGESNHDNSIKSSVDLTANVEECVRRLFNTSASVETFIQDVQQILNVTIKSSLSLFLIETIPLAHQYLQQCQYDPYSWDTFKVIAIQRPSTVSNLFNQPTTITRLPSLQQACFRLPPTYPQLIDLTSSISPNIRPDANCYEQKLIHRFAQNNFYLNSDGEQLILQTLYKFLKHIIRRLLFFTQHRTDTRLFHSNAYEMMSNVREQIRYLIQLHKTQNGGLNSNLNMNIYQRKSEMNSITDEDLKRIRVGDYQPTTIEQLRRKEADETACLVLRESRLKRQKRENNQQPLFPTRILRASLQELIAVMENESTLKRSKTLLYAYANR